MAPSIANSVYMPVFGHYTESSSSDKLCTPAAVACDLFPPWSSGHSMAEETLHLLAAPSSYHALVRVEMCPLVPRASYYPLWTFPYGHALPGCRIHQSLGPCCLRETDSLKKLHCSHYDACWGTRVQTQCVHGRGRAHLVQMVKLVIARRNWRS